MEEQEKKDARITVRLSAEMFEELSIVAKEFNISNSDVIRKTLTHNLAEVSALKRKRMTVEEREIIINEYHKVVKSLNQFASGNTKFGANIHHLLKRLNENPNLDKDEIKNIIKDMSFFTLNNYNKKCDERINIMRKELDKIWQLLQ